MLEMSQEDLDTILILLNQYKLLFLDDLCNTNYPKNILRVKNIEILRTNYFVIPP